MRQAAGLLALGGILDADGVPVSVAADSAYGVHATTSIYVPATAGALTFANGSISTSGLGSHGAVATASAFVTDLPTLRLQNATITTAGGGAHGLAAFNGGAIDATGSAIRAEGSGGYGLFSSATTLTRLNDVSISGGSLASAQSTAIYVGGSRLDLSLSNGVQVTGGAGALFEVAPVAARAGTLTLAADSAVLTGAASTAAGSTSEMTLANNSLWNITGASNLSRLVNDRSAIAFSAPSAAPNLASSYKTLVVGDYVGDGGTITLNTFLGADGSPSDRLVIDGGQASGQTGLVITRAGGPGAVTLGDGIQVVDAIGGGGTNADAFALAQRVVEGPYEYLLVRSSLDASNAEAWYLRSERAGPEVVPPPDPPTDPGVDPPTQPPPPPPSPDPGVDPPTQPPTRPDPESALPPPAPLYRPEVSAYLANQRLANSMFIRSLVDRLGEPQWIETQGFDAAGDVGRSAWLRVEARENSSTSRDGALGADTDTTLIQGGGEIARWAVGGERARLHLGVMIGYARRVGDWILEPQARLVYIDYSEDDVIEVNGTRVAGADGDGLISRLGLRTYRNWVSSDLGRRAQPYLVLNWWHDSIPDTLAFNQVALKELYPDDRYELKAGVNAQFGQAWSAWGNLGYQWGAQDYHDAAVRLDAKYTW